MLKLLRLLILIALPISTALAEPVKQHRVTLKDGHSLALYSRSAETPWASILLIHGRTWSALPDFDLTTQSEDLSMMKALAAEGLAVYAIDLRGYGQSARDASGWNTPNQAVDDVAQVIDFINNKHKTLEKVNVFGWSNGSLVTLLAAQQHPEKIRSIVLYGFPLDTGKVIGQQTLPDKAPRIPTTEKAAAEDFILPGTISPAAIAAYTKAAVKADPIRSDWRALEQWNQLDGTKVKLPTLLLQAESDPYMNVVADAELFKKIAGKNKQWIILGDAGHAALLETSRFKLYHAVISFMRGLDK